MHRDPRVHPSAGDKLRECDYHSGWGFEWLIQSVFERGNRTWVCVELIGSRIRSEGRDGERWYMTLEDYRDGFKYSEVIHTVTAANLAQVESLDSQEVAS